MDLYANKKIKITKNALNESELTLTNKKLFQKNGFSLNNLKNRRFYSTSKNKEDKYLSYITPIKQKKSISKVINLIEKKSKDFSVIDIETMDLNGQEYPICISFKNRSKENIFMIDHSKLLENIDKALDSLWNNLFDFILKHCNKNVIFVHNLGNFDGFFIYKALSNRFKPEEVSCLIDHHNKFIQITLEIDKFKIVF